MYQRPPKHNNRCVMPAEIQIGCQRVNLCCMPFSHSCRLSVSACCSRFFPHHLSPGPTQKVRLADVQVAASWNDVMSPLPPPSDGVAVNSADAPTFSGGSTVSSTSTTATSTNAPGGGIPLRNDNDSSTAAALAGEMMRFQIEAGDGLSKADAADLTLILRKVS